MYKLILLDFSMPEMDGPEVAVQIRRLIDEAAIEQPYICCCTAYTNDSYGRRAIESGMNQVLTKPIKSSHLSQLLREQNLLWVSRFCSFSFFYYVFANEFFPINHSLTTTFFLILYNSYTKI